MCICDVRVVCFPLRVLFARVLFARVLRARVLCARVLFASVVCAGDVCTGDAPMYHRLDSSGVLFGGAAARFATCVVLSQLHQLNTVVIVHSSSCFVLHTICAWLNSTQSEVACAHGLERGTRSSKKRGAQLWG